MGLAQCLLDRVELINHLQGIITVFALLKAGVTGAEL